jgi:hypothetical protein
VLTHEVLDHNDTSINTKEIAERLTASGHTAKDPVSSGEIGTSGLRTQENTRQEQIQAVIDAFWDLVNTKAHKDHQPSNTPFVDNASTGDGTPEDADTVNVHYGWVDGPVDTPPPIELQGELSTQEQPCPNARHRSNYTNAKYDAFRRAIPHPKGSTGYYRQWLVECRLEIRDIVRPEGPTIQDPPKLRM